MVYSTKIILKMALQPVAAANAMYIETDAYRLPGHQSYNTPVNPMFSKLPAYIFRRRNAVCEDSIKAVIKQLQERNIISS